MSLDLSQTVLQVQAAAQRLKSSASAQAQRLALALSTYERCSQPASATFDHLKAKIALSQGKVTFLVAGVAAPPDAIGADAAPTDYIALATDGSHIDVDRHSPAQVYLINISKVALRYGASPEATLSSSPTLYAAPEDMVLKDPASAYEIPVEGPLVGVRRTVSELAALLDLAEQAPNGVPLLALVDGSLILWTLAGQGYPEFVRDTFLVDGFLKLLDKALELHKKKGLLLASYISHPRSTDVVNALRMDSELCPYEVADCDKHCGKLAWGQRPCDKIAGVMDRDVFARTLSVEERSTPFLSLSSIVQKYYGVHQVYFFYVNIGGEIARIEIPAWLAQDSEAPNLLQALLLDQTRRGLGYPVALAEAHEQAVVTTGDRERFWEMVANAMESQGLAPAVSAKSRSKELPWV